MGLPQVAATRLQLYILRGVTFGTTTDLQDRVETRSPRDDAVRLTVAASALLMAAITPSSLPTPLVGKCHRAVDPVVVVSQCAADMCSAQVQAHGHANILCAFPLHLQSSFPVPSVLAPISSFHTECGDEMQQ